METSLTVGTNDYSAAPDRDWCSAGLIVQLQGSPGDYVMVNLGRQGSAFGMPRTYGSQCMNTDGGSTQFDYESSSDGSAALEGRLRICRVGDEIRWLRNAPGDGGWIELGFRPNQGPEAAARPDLAGGTGE